MPLFFRTYNEKSFDSSKLGKWKKYRLPRGDSSLLVKGKLLGFYREAIAIDPYHDNYVKLLAIFKTRSGRYAVYYTLEYVNSEHQEGEIEYVKVFPLFEQAAHFIEGLQYANSEKFMEVIIGQSQQFDKM